MKEEKLPSFKDVQKAYALIKNIVHHTPVLSSQNLNLIANCEMYFKCENFQKVGAFKFRGATNALENLPENRLKYGVATHSSGNHAAALALAAKNKKTQSFIVIPSNAPEVKKNAVANYGANIIFCEPTLEARETTLNKVIKKTNAEFIHPYNNFHVIAGQGTAAYELIQEINNLDIILAPVGGGGLLSGTAISAKAINPNIKVIGTEPKGADDAYQSYYKKTFIPSELPNTIADGLLTSLGSITFPIILSKVDQIITVSEESIIRAMQLIWERMKIIVEPSSSVPFAAILENPSVFKNKKIGIIISGGNVDLKKLPF